MHYNNNSLFLYFAASGSNFHQLITENRKTAGTSFTINIKRAKGDLLSLFTFQFPMSYQGSKVSDTDIRQALHDEKKKRLQFWSTTKFLQLILIESMKICEES